MEGFGLLRVLLAHSSAERIRTDSQLFGHLGLAAAGLLDSPDHFQIEIGRQVQNGMTSLQTFKKGLKMTPEKRRNDESEEALWRVTQVGAPVR